MSVKGSHFEPQIKWVRDATRLTTSRSVICSSSTDLLVFIISNLLVVAESRNSSLLCCLLRHSTISFARLKQEQTLPKRKRRVYIRQHLISSASAIQITGPTGKMVQPNKMLAPKVREIFHWYDLVFLKPSSGGRYSIPVQGTTLPSNLQLDICYTWDLRVVYIVSLVA